MAIEGLYSQQAEPDSVGTSSTKEQVLNGLRSSADYRQAFIEEAIRSRITAQIAALRSREGWDYKKFAERIHKKVSWAYRLEDPNGPAPTIPSLLEVAAAFDIGLDVRFRSFSELLDDVAGLDKLSFWVPSFNEELKYGAFSKPRGRRSYRKPNRKSRQVLRFPRKPGSENVSDRIGSIGSAESDAGGALGGSLMPLAS